MLGLRGARTGRDGARWSAGAFDFSLLSVSCAHIGDLRLITLNSMKASEEITDEQSRQVSPGYDTVDVHALHTDIYSSCLMWSMPTLSSSEV